MEMDAEEGQPETSMMTASQRKTPALRNPNVAFRDTCRMLQDTCPLAFYNPKDGGLTFGMVVGRLDAVCKDKFAKKLDDRIVRATTHGFDERVTNQCIVDHYLPMPVHYSPLVALLEGIKRNTFTDAISSMRQLLFLRIYYYKVALDEPEHCKECEKAYHKIHGRASDIFFDKVDHLLAQKDELGPQLAVSTFAAIFEEYQLARIRAVEWNILDMLSVPLAYRVNFLTPSTMPHGSRLSQKQGEILRDNLVRYLKKRKDIYGGSLQILSKEGLLDKGSNKMDVDHEDGPKPCQADKLRVQTLERDFRQPASQKHKGWICISTLLSYLEFLDTPKKQK